MFKEFLSKVGVTKLLDKVRLAGMTIRETFAENKSNTAKSFNNLFKRTVMNDAPIAEQVQTFTEQAEKIVKTRRRQTLTTIKNTMVAVRGRGRAIVSLNRSGTWHNNGVLDSGTTHICTSYMGASWKIPYSQIPDKPPRIAKTPHPCRSFLTFVPDGEDGAPDETDFMTRFNDDEDLRGELLGVSRLEAYNTGELRINSFADYEKATLSTIEELGL